MTPPFQHRRIASFDQQTRLRFSPGIAEHDAASIGFNFRFGLGHRFQDAVDLVERFFLPDTNVGDQLGKARPALNQFGKRFVLRFHDAQNLQGGDQTVTGGAVVAEDQVAALLTAEVESVAQHFIDDISVADRCAHGHSPGGTDGQDAGAPGAFDAENLDTASIAAALRGVIQQPAVARRTAVAVLELTKHVATTSDAGRALIGRELESLLDQLGDDSFAPIVRSLRDHARQQQRFVNQLVDALPLPSAPAWLSAAAVAAEKPMSQQLMRLMTKLSTLADDRGDVATEAAFRDATHDLVSGWTLADPNPEHHVELLDRIAAFERSAGTLPLRSGTARKSVVESMRLVQMALELDCGGEDTAAAAEALLATGSGRVLLSWLDAAGDTATARWLRSVATSERAVRQLLLNEPVDRLDARALLALLDTSYTETLLDVLAEAGTRGTRLIVRQRLAEFGHEITPRLLSRLDEAPWFVVRNILTLLHDLAMQQSGTAVGSETMLRLLDHGQVQVRVEAVRLLLLMDDGARDAALHRALDDANDRVAMVAIEALAESATADGALPEPLLARLKALVDAGTRSDTVRARAVRVVAPLQDAATRDWLIGLVTHRTRFLRRLALNQPSQTAAAALQVLLRAYPEDPDVRAVRVLAKRDARDPRWMARDPGILTEHVA